ncbi:MAG TPA: hypothetical protein VGK67_03620 [Myxococcales bacterium]|jgi:hypothetical protein
MRLKDIEDGVQAPATASRPVASAAARARASGQVAPAAGHGTEFKHF